MPADPLRSNSSRRPFRKLPNDEEIEIRRARGEVSCAECRRLKLKCDKKLPCSSCVRRGCQSICPNGSLSTGQGTRFVLADTEQLHRKIAEMGRRIRQLEDALAIFQAGVSNECHPLLREELLVVKFGPEVHTLPSNNQTGTPPDITESLDALGTLTIKGDQGESYYGRSAGSETLFLAGAAMEAEETDTLDDVEAITAELSDVAKLFPFVPGGPWHSEETLDVLLTLIPPQPRAWTLCETYLEQASWSFRPLRRDEYIDDILTPIYKYAKEKHNPGSEAYGSKLNPHKLAVLFLIFAIGSLVDLTVPAFGVEAESFHQLGRAALSLRDVFNSPDIYTVQSILLMGSYHTLAGRGYSMDCAWNFFSLSAKLAQSIGLHRDSARWNLDAKAVQRRRSLFWEIFALDNFASLALGRPPSVALSYVDCELPEDDEQTLDKNGQPIMGFWAWKYMFIKEVFAVVTQRILTAAPPKYETILELDRKIREYPLPPHLSGPFSPDVQYSPSEYMKGTLLTHIRSIAMLYIHRSFFAQALLDYPVNPLRSPYAPSFLAAYRCASVVIRSNLKVFERFPDLCMRWWNVWTHLFSASIIVGSIVTRSPSSSMAATAFIELGLAVDLFERGARLSRRARNGMAILSRLREKAVQVYSEYRSGNMSPNTDLHLHTRHENDDEDELAIFGGQTRVLISKLISKKSPSSSRTTSTSPPPSHPSPEGKQAPPAIADPAVDVHPTLVEYLSLFPLSAYTPGASLKDVYDPPSSDFVEPSTFGTQPPQEALNMQPSTVNQFTLSNIYSDFSYENFFSPMSLEVQNPMTHPGPGEMSHTEGSPDGLIDLGGDSHIDSQWMSFMRDSGFLDNTNGV